MREKSVITRKIEAAGGVYAPGHLGELTQIVDFDAGGRGRRGDRDRAAAARLLPSRVVVYFVLALALFEHCSYRGVWAKMTAGLRVLKLAPPAASSLTRARRRVGPKPFRALFEAIRGARRPPATGRVVLPRTAHRGRRRDDLLHVPEALQLTWRYAKRAGEKLDFGYPLLRLRVLVECGTRAVIAAVFGPEADGELTYAQRLLDGLTEGMLLLADAGFDSWRVACGHRRHRGPVPVRSGARRTPPILRAPARRLLPGRSLRRLRPAHGPRHRGVGHRDLGRRHRHAASSGAWSPACSTTAATPPTTL